LVVQVGGSGGGARGHSGVSFCGYLWVAARNIVIYQDFIHTLGVRSASYCTAR
jgi:hypothetical protein